MGVQAAVFESAGKRTEHYVPGTYSRSQNISNPTGISRGNLCVLGKSTGGKPQTLLEFSSIAEAQNTLVSGDLLTAVAYAFSGSSDYVPNKVYAMRVNPGTQASLTLSAGGTDVLKLSSWDYGAHTNQLKILISTGSTTNSKVVTTVYKDTTVTSEDIVRESISLQYIGSGSNPTVTVSTTSISMTATTADGTDSLEIAFDEVDTIDELVTRINDSGLFSATNLESDSDAEIELDTVSGVDISSSVTLYSNFAAFIDYLESNEYIGEGNVEWISESTRVVPDNTDGYKYFTGGTLGDYTASEWNDALEVLSKENIQIVTSPTTSSTIQALIVAHCKTMSNTINRKERTFWLGASLNASDSDGITTAKSFNTKYGSYVIDSVTTTNPLTDETEEISGAMLAVMLAGIEAALPINEPLTNKSLNILGFSTIRDISNMEKLIKAGVVVCNPNPEDNKKYVCIRAITTYQGNDLISCERSMTREDLYMNRDLRSHFGTGVGRPNLGDTASIIQTLKDAAKEWQGLGLIIPNKSNNNVWNIKVIIGADKVYLKYSRFLTAPTNFIFITATNKTYSKAVEL